MSVRLAFSVAAHLEPEILIIDEVLAVGDIGFQKKCLGKMNEVAGQGRTILFVSHNLNAVSNLCSSALILNHGRCVAKGSTDLIIDKYLEIGTSKSLHFREWSYNEAPGNEVAKILKYHVYANSKKNDRIFENDIVAFKVDYIMMKDSPQIDLSLHVYNSENLLLAVLSSSFIDDFKNPVKKNETKKITFTLKSSPFKEGNYKATLRIIEGRASMAILKIEEFIHFRIDKAKKEVFHSNKGIINCQYEVSSRL
jgi:lipopolysaccharide transport system ATP-binding protein